MDLGQLDSQQQGWQQVVLQQVVLQQHGSQQGGQQQRAMVSGVEGFTLFTSEFTTV